ncbi:MAG: capsular polysaccharide export protein, LipB/KpsS family [Acidimicrobiales bacterium]
MTQGWKRGAASPASLEPSRRSVVLLTYRAELPWAVALAGELGEGGYSCEAWVFDGWEKARAEASGRFNSVVALTEGFARPRSSTPEESRELLSRARDMERRLGGPFLHEIAAVDRTITGRDHIEVPPIQIRRRWTWEELVSLALHIEKVVRDRLRTVDPVAVAGEPGGFLERIMVRVVKATGTRFMGPGFIAYHPDRLFFTDRLDGQWPGFETTYKELRSLGIPPEAGAAADAVIRKINTSGTLEVPREDIRTFLPTKWERFGPDRVLNVARTWWTARAGRFADSPRQTYKELVTPQARVRRKLERYAVRQAYERSAHRSIPAPPYAAFFLHTQPEVTVEGWSFDFADQVAVARSIAAALPADMVLAVKEHRYQAGVRDPTFYAELLSIPGVVLVHDMVDTRSLVSGSRLVLTLTGTVALEAMCLRRPAVIFGSVYYEHVPGISRVNDFNVLRTLVADLDRFPLASEQEIRCTFAAQFVASHPAGWLSGGRYSADARATAQAMRTEWGEFAAEQKPSSSPLAGDHPEVGREQVGGQEVLEGVADPVPLLDQHLTQER